MAMSRRTRTGIGIGCGVVAVILLVVVGGAIYLAKQMTEQYKTVHETEQTLLAATGEVAAWQAPVGGVPESSRLEAFTAVRADLDEWRANLDTAIDAFLVKKGSGQGGLGHWWRMFQAGSDLAPVYAGYWTARNESLLARGMSPAEYIYLYVLAYYGDLGYSSEDGYHVDPEGRDASGAERADIDRNRMLVELRQVLQPVLARMVFVTDAGEVAHAGLTPAEVDRELERLAQAPRRLPWQDGLPPALAAAFAPYRLELATSYSPMVNPVELLFEAITAEEPPAESPANE